MLDCIYNGYLFCSVRPEGVPENKGRSEENTERERERECGEMGERSGGKIGVFVRQSGLLMGKISAGRCQGTGG